MLFVMLLVCVALLAAAVVGLVAPRRVGMAGRIKALGLYGGGAAAVFIATVVAFPQGGAEPAPGAVARAPADAEAKAQYCAYDARRDALYRAVDARLGATVAESLQPGERLVVAGPAPIDLGTVGDTTTPEGAAAFVHALKHPAHGDTLTILDRTTNERGALFYEVEWNGQAGMLAAGALEGWYGDRQRRLAHQQARDAALEDIAGPVRVELFGSKARWEAVMDQAAIDGWRCN